MNTEKLFRIISAILMPIVFILAFIMIPFVFISFSNPVMLLGVFVFACVVIYMVKSVQFFRRNIVPGMPAKAGNRDWIRVNAFVSIFFVLQILYNAYYLFFMHKEIMTTLQVWINTMEDAQGTTSMPVSAELVYGALKNLMIFFLIFDVLLAVHIVCSFKLLKKYKELFVHQ
ncbi:hypothetical protein [Arachidicoccus terrestris]|uniref:hypothetical protein n=1 Tax=Arachidicoccus terrestris TaxID=2875539 RepID=UPI001CC6B5AF|nr:hypothetical protein [Arachidicoccus terrestris]UAY55967.1 hypothetical protein K9M52_02745 [Arachidicoccus terrestris]